MMAQSNLPTIQRLKWEDISRAKTWQEALQLLITTLNLFISPVYDILNGGITKQNVVSPQVVLKTITAATLTTFSFANPIKGQPSAVLIGNVWSAVPTAHPGSTVQAFWHITGDQIVIDNVIGLTPGTIYQLTLIII